jgi:hypothetical protein
MTKRPRPAEAEPFPFLDLMPELREYVRAYLSKRQRAWLSLTSREMLLECPIQELDPALRTALERTRSTRNGQPRLLLQTIAALMDIEDWCMPRLATCQVHSLDVILQFPNGLLLAVSIIGSWLLHCELRFPLNPCRRLTVLMDGSITIISRVADLRLLVSRMLSAPCVIEALLASNWQEADRLSRRTHDSTGGVWFPNMWQYESYREWTSRRMVTCPD